MVTTAMFITRFPAIILPPRRGLSLWPHLSSLFLLPVNPGWGVRLSLLPLPRPRLWSYPLPPPVLRPRFPPDVCWMQPWSRSLGCSAYWARVAFTMSM
jgi:hypothetical protein